MKTAFEIQSDAEMQNKWDELNRKICALIRRDGIEWNDCTNEYLDKILIMSVKLQEFETSRVIQNEIERRRLNSTK